MSDGGSETNFYEKQDQEYRAHRENVSAKKKALRTARAETRSRWWSHDHRLGRWVGTLKSKCKRCNRSTINSEGKLVLTDAKCLRIEKPVKPAAPKKYQEAVKSVVVAAAPKKPDKKAAGGKK